MSDFARHASLGSPALSPDGKCLAVRVREEDHDADSSRYQLAVLELPSLKPLTKPNMAPYTRPARIALVSTTRLIVEKARESGTLDAPGLTREIVALNFDGSQQRILYSFEARGSGANSAMLRMPYGYPEVVGIPSSYNGHLYLQIAPAPANANGQSSDTYRTLLFDVDTVSGYPVEIASIDRSDMRFVVTDGKPWYAEGVNDNNDPVVYRATDAGKSWSLMPAGVVGKGGRSAPIASTSMRWTAPTAGPRVWLRHASTAAKHACWPATRSFPSTRCASRRSRGSLTPR